MTPLTVVCLLVKGEYSAYTPECVRRLKVMCDRFCPLPFRFVCLTDQPDAMPHGVEARTVTRLAGHAYWTKLRLFDPAQEWQGRVLYLDLDSLLVATLEPIINFPAVFALTEDAWVVERAHLDRDRYGRRLNRRFNSSVMVWNGGTQTELFTEWNPSESEFWSTDQDFIGARATSAKSMPLAWFPRLSRVQPPWPEDAKVVLAKKPKCFDAIEKWPWFDQAWGGWAS